MTMVPAAAAHSHRRRRRHHQNQKQINPSFECDTDQLMISHDYDVPGYEYYLCCNYNSQLIQLGGSQDQELATTNTTHHMAEQNQGESRTNSLNEVQHSHRDVVNDQEREQEQQEEEGWLRLSIGSSSSCHGIRTAITRAQNNITSSKQDHHDTLLVSTSTSTSTTSAARESFLELDLLPPGRGGGDSGGDDDRSGRDMNRGSPHDILPLPPHVLVRPASLTPTMFQIPPSPSAFINYNTAGASSSSFLPPPPPSYPYDYPLHHRDFNWPAFRPIGGFLSTTNTSSSSSSSPSSCFNSLRPLGTISSPYANINYARPSFSGVNVGVPSSFDVLRVIDPPRRPHSGIWFMLQASQNQARDPFLPQIPKSFLRIRDGRMTVSLLKKYLVNKLRLDSESEVEITCRGQHLVPILTLQHVRDNVWSPRDAPPLLTNSSNSLDHVMVLHYGRTA